MRKLLELQVKGQVIVTVIKYEHVVGGSGSCSSMHLKATSN